MDDLQLGLGMINASRNAAKARQIAQQQLAEAQTASKYARDAAAAAKDSAKSEEQRLALEKERFAAEQHERLLRQQDGQEQQWTREILADALVDFERFAGQPVPVNGTPAAVAWQRNIALLDGKLSILEGRQEWLTELADMTEFRKFKGRLKDFMRVQAEAGHCSGTPLQTALDELSGVRAFAASAGAVYEEGKAFGAEWLRQDAPVITHQVWQTRQSDLAEWKANLPARLDTLQDGSSKGWWDAGGGLCKGLQTLLILEPSLAGEKLKPELKEDAPAKESESIRLWSLFKKKEGRFYEELTAHLDEIGVRLQTLENDYQADLPRWVQAGALAEPGNFQQAEAVLRQCSNKVISSELDRCREEISSWRKKLNEVTDQPIVKEVKSSASRSMPLSPFAFEKEAATRKSKIAQASGWVEQVKTDVMQWQTATKHTKADFDKAVDMALSEHEQALVSAGRMLDKQIFQHRMWAAVTAVIVTACVAGAITLSWQMQTKKARQKMVKRHAVEQAERRRVAQAAEQAQEEQERGQEMQARHVRQEAERTRQEANTATRREEAQKIAEAERREEMRLTSLREEQREQKRAVAFARGGMLYGSEPVAIKLKSGSLTMRSGARYRVIAGAVRGCLCVHPDYWGSEGSYNSDYYYSSTGQEIADELANGIEVPISSLTDEPPASEPSIPGLP